MLEILLTCFIQGIVRLMFQNILVYYTLKSIYIYKQTFLEHSGDTSGYNEQF